MKDSIPYTVCYRARTHFTVRTGYCVEQEFFVDEQQLHCPQVGRARSKYPEVASWTTNEKLVTEEIISAQTLFILNYAQCDGTHGNG